MGTCLNCKKIKKLQQSHIIPEFFYKYVYTKDHKFILVSDSNENDLKIEQKGYREKLFCHDCEELLSAQEKITADFFRELITQSYNNIKATKISDSILLVENYNYSIIKKCLLSILWRASISRRNEFSDYDLGSYNKKIQDLIFSTDTIPWLKYPIHISKVKLDKNYTPELLLVHKKGKYKNYITLYSITLAGYNIDYYISEEFDKELEVYFMNEKFCGITDISLEELKLSGDLINRLKKSDIANFYNKHK